MYIYIYILYPQGSTVSIGHFASSHRPLATGRLLPLGPAGTFQLGEELLATNKTNKSMWSYHGQI